MKTTSEGKFIMNEITLVGNLTRDAESITTRSNKQLCKFTIAHSKKKDDDDPLFIECVVFDYDKEVKKGQRVQVNGRLANGNYVAKDGTKRYTFSIMVNELELIEKKVQKTEKPELTEEQIMKLKSKLTPEQLKELGL